MGQTNAKASTIDRIARLERELDELRKAVGLSSATISRGGLTLTNDAFLSMVDDLGVQILYAGPDSEGRQVVMLTREGGAPVLYTYFTVGGEQYWAMTDRSHNQIVADDAVSGMGLARPRIPWPTRPRKYDFLPNSAATSWDAVMDTGFQSKQHPYAFAQVIHSTTASDTSGQGRLTIDGVQVGAVFNIGWSVNFTNVGPFALPGSHMANTNIVLEVQRTAGTGKVGASMIVLSEQS